jgi:DNA-binding response OmpR family regulator
MADESQGIPTLAVMDFPFAQRSPMVEARKKILCIEDDRELAGLIAEELADRGFEAVVAYDGHEGFVAILKHGPDLVLCDINMPIMSGFEVLERLIDIAPRFGRVPFVFLTAMTDRESELRGRRLGADDYVTKPIDFEVLHTIINARLAGVARNETWPKLIALNDREIETLTWVARGKTSAQIATMSICPSGRSISTSTMPASSWAPQRAHRPR